MTKRGLVSTQMVLMAALLAIVLAPGVRAQFAPSSGSAITQDQLDAAITTMQNAVMAAMPQPSNVIPPTDTLNGGVGVSTTRFMREDAPRPTISQRATVTTDASGNFSVTWAKAFTSSTPAIFVTPLLAAATQPVTCVVFTRSSTTATGKCWQNAVQAVALISLTISLVPVNFASSSVMVIGLEPSQ